MNINIDNGADYNEKGVTPNIGMPAEDEAESTTKATVSEGEIEIRDKENQKQDLAGLNRDAQNALNKLGEIFDKDSLEERQELAGLFGELAYNQIHYMEGTDEQKAAYHALVGGIMAELTNGDFLAGASAAAVNKLVVEEINKIADGDPAMAQWLSAALGAVITGDKSGASIAASGTKNNFYHLWVKDIIQSFDKNDLSLNEAYAISFSVGKDINYFNPKIVSDGILVGCYVARNKYSGELEVYDTTGAQISIGFSTLTNILKNKSVTITKIDFGNNYASEYLSGGSLYLSADATTLHVGASVTLDSIYNAKNIEDAFVYTEYGTSSELTAAITAGLSYTIPMGEVNNSLTWTAFGSIKDVKIREFIKYVPSNNYLIYKNKQSQETSIIIKTDAGYKTLVGFSDENLKDRNGNFIMNENKEPIKKPIWENVHALPDKRLYDLIS